MGWVNEALEQLSAGQDAHIRPQGGSMRGRIESGDLVTLSPVDAREVKVDDVVLVQWQRSYLLHLVREIRGDEFLIGNNLGKINGWVKAQAVRGRVVSVVHDASVSPDSDFSTV
ncbi:MULTISPECIES: S24/S26 family peptidase [Prosthecobacter]|uniref:Peptidase S24/S26A/S26B/S26C domain-containing protein n=2 Tax=Prosthecobacter TaxID=48463 RepID=A0A7W8DLU8_9BACT|nr:hypothetical protein [Prosthecobacter vanneervenii]MBB5034532.1 hypothetical protein [Prosthecobacter vanneervenii]